MLTCECINPEIMDVLALCGHGSKILIADGNYPLAEKSGDSKKVYLGLRKDLPTVTDVLTTLKAVINIEKAEVMAPQEGPEPMIFKEFVDITGLKLAKLERYEFYANASKDIVLAISTGESRTFANILLTVGVA